MACKRLVRRRGGSPACLRTHGTLSDMEWHNENDRMKDRKIRRLRREGSDHALPDRHLDRRRRPFSDGWSASLCQAPREPSSPVPTAADVCGTKPTASLFGWKLHLGEIPAMLVEGARLYLCLEAGCEESEGSLALSFGAYPVRRSDL